MTLFAHPETAKQLRNKNVFRVIRASPQSLRGKVGKYDDQYGQIMYCDNLTPADAFKWVAPDIQFGRDLQCNHIYRDSSNVNLYTALANLCFTPSFLAKLTDTDPEIQNLLRYRVFDLYGFVPESEPQPEMPIYYQSLKWHSFPNPVKDVEKTYISRMESCQKRRSTCSARDIGWHFSDYRPDPRLSRLSRAA